MATVSEIFLAPKKRDIGTLKLSSSLYYIEQTKILTLIVKFTDNTGTAELAEVASGPDGYGNTVTVPPVGAYLSGTYMSCRSVQATRLGDEDATSFEVMVEFSNALQNYSTDSGNWNVQIEVEGVEYTQDAYFDSNGYPIVNTAGKRFEPTLQKTFYDEAIRVKFATASPDTTNIAACRGKVNSGSCTISVSALGYSRTFATRCLKLTNGKYSSKIVNSQPWWDVSYDFLTRTQTAPQTVAAPYASLSDTTVGFIDFVPDTGWESFSSGGGSGSGGAGYNAIYNADGSWSVTPPWLDGNGNADNSTNMYQNSDAVFDAFEIEDAVDFTSLLSAI